MKYYVTYPANTEIPWLTDSTVTMEASTDEEARRNFASNGYKNTRNCIRITSIDKWSDDRRHPMTALWEDSTTEDGKFDQCQASGHWLQWVEKQYHPNHNIDQYNPFVPRDHGQTWDYKLAVFCCTCGVIIHKEEGKSGVPEQPMVAWYVKRSENRPKTIHS